MRHVATLLAAVVCALTLASKARADDAYEPDDAPSQARVIIIDDSDAQQHDFSKSSDVDWVKFYALAGQDYEITVRNAGPRCDAVIELYGSDGQTLLASRDDNGSGGQERLPFMPDADGPVYVMVRNYHGAVYGGGTTYDLRVYRPYGPTLSGILTGRVYEYTTGTPVENALIRSGSGGSTISIDTGLYLLRDFEQDITITAAAEGFRPFSAGVTLTPGSVALLDIPLELDPSSGCAARLQGDLALLIPRISAGNTLIWATMTYDTSRQDKAIFEVKGAGFITDPSVPVGCVPVSLAADLKLDLPTILFDGMVLKAIMELDSIVGDRVFFAVTSVDIVSNPQP